MRRKQKYSQAYKPKKTLARPNRLRRREISKARLLATAVFFAVTGAWFAYFFLFSDNFKIKNITLEGVVNIPDGEMDEIIKNNLRGRVGLIFPNSNIWLFSKERLRADIAQKYIVESVKIDKQPPFGLAIKIQEKLARLVLRTLSEIKVEADLAGEYASSTDPALAEPTFIQNYFYLDVNGIVVSAETDITERTLENFPAIQITYAGITPVKPGDSVLNREKISYIQSIYEELASSNTGVKIDYLIYDPEQENELKIATKEGWQILINTGLDAADQVRKLELALSEKIRDKRAGLQYVDLRINDRVYYK